jgi:glycosyltransferase involved in cell wall biosynthesis
MNVTETPLFSVVIPTYNRASMLKRAVESVLAQSYSNFEILVMDDGSTDNTPDVVASFDDPRITYGWEANFGGPARPRNRGIALARGEWICFLDADDWWSTNKLQICFECINSKVDLIYHDLEIVRDPPSFFKRKRIKSRQVRKSVLKDLLLKGNPIATSSVVVRKNLLDQISGMNESLDMVAAEDYNTWLRIAQLTDNFFHIPKSLGYYLFHTGSISRKNIEQLLLSVCKEFMYLLEPQEKVIYNAMAGYSIALEDFFSGRTSAARKRLLYSIRYGSLPIKVKSLFLYIFLSLNSENSYH